MKFLFSVPDNFLRLDCSFLSSVVAVLCTTFFFLLAVPLPPIRTLACICFSFSGFILKSATIYKQLNHCIGLQFKSNTCISLLWDFIMQRMFTSFSPMIDDVPMIWSQWQCSAQLRMKVNMITLSLSTLSLHQPAQHNYKLPIETIYY